MKRALFVAVLNGALLVPALGFGQDCSQYNQFVYDPAPDYSWDATGHANPWSDPQSSMHWMRARGNGSCTYTGPAGSPCTARCIADMSYDAGDVGIFSNPFVTSHDVVDDYAPGSGSGSAGGGVACQAVAAVSTVPCYATFFCSASISVTAGNFGATIAFDPNSLWNHSHPYTVACQGQTAPAQYSDPTCTTATQGCPLYSYWSPTACSCVYAQTNSPIVIDTDGSGFHLTSAAAGVMFDFYGTGTPIKISWTAPNSTNGWLALDRNGDGKIESAKELFGNLTEQPPSENPNGFLALAVFDLPANGGDGDGIIDSQDAVWSKLRVWIDSNHDGISQPEELHTLDELGIRAIDLKYHPSRYADQYGNHFRYKGSLRTDAGASVDRQIYDVILVTASPVPVQQTPAGAKH